MNVTAPSFETKECRGFYAHWQSLPKINLVPTSESFFRFAAPILRAIRIHIRILRVRCIYSLDGNSPRRSLENRPYGSALSDNTRLRNKEDFCNQPLSHCYQAVRPSCHQSFSAVSRLTDFNRSDRLTFGSSARTTFAICLV